MSFKNIAQAKLYLADAQEAFKKQKEVGDMLRSPLMMPKQEELQMSHGTAVKKQSELEFYFLLCIEYTNKWIAEKQTAEVTIEEIEK